MMQNSAIFTLCLIFGAAVAEPLRLASNNDVLNAEPSYEMAARTDITSIFDIMSAVIGYKISAVSCALSAINWVVSNFSIIIIGTATVLGFCKLTGKCNLNYEDYLPISQIQSYATTENLETAEKLLLTAVEKYTENKRSLS